MPVVMTSMWTEISADNLPSQVLPNPLVFIRMLVDIGSSNR